MLPSYPPPPNCSAFWFQAEGRFAWNLMSGAVESTGLMLPVTLQYSLLALPASVACTNVVEVTTAPFVGNEHWDAGSCIVTSASQAALFVASRGSSGRTRATAAVTVEAPSSASSVLSAIICFTATA